MKTYIGIDPGKSGGIAVIDGENGGQRIRYWKMPATERDVWDLVHSFNSGLFGGDMLKMNDAFAVIEQVHAMPKQGVTSVWTFSGSYHGVRMALIGAGIPFETVTPQKWQKFMGCMSKGDKNVTKRRAQELFPDVKMSHAIADALLLSEYCRRTRNYSEVLQ